MKPFKFDRLLVLGLLLAIAAAPGCRKRPDNVAYIPGRTPGQIPDMPPPGPALGDTNKISSEFSGIPQTDPDKRKLWPRDAKIFEADTAHFDFDSSVLKSADKPKVSAVADYLKAHPENCLEVDGHCDERGTEGYNQSLGERRALALREQLVSLGIDPARIDTATYGKDRPKDPGHDEAAWSQNRRGEFLLEIPPKAPTNP